jgi:hypothetical protein
MWRRDTQGAGMAVIEQALAKALPQLDLARTAASLCDAGLADALADVVTSMTNLQKRVARTQRDQADAICSADGADTRDVVKQWPAI